MARVVKVRDGLAQIKDNSAHQMYIITPQMRQLKQFSKLGQTFKGKIGMFVFSLPQIKVNDYTVRANKYITEHILRFDTGSAT